MFYDNRVNQIRERRRVIQKIRSQIEAYEAGDPDCDFDPEAEMPCPYLQLKVIYQNFETLEEKMNIEISKIESECLYFDFHFKSLEII